MSAATHKHAQKDLPPGWRWEKIDHLVTEAMAGFACGQRDEAGIIQIRMQNLNTGGDFVWENLVRIPSHCHPFEKFLLKKNDVLFNNTNSTELVGKSALFDCYKEPVVFSNHYTRLRTDDNKLDPGYLAYWLVNLWQEGVFAAICNRWIGQSAIKNDKLLKLDIPLPPLAEQQRIAGILKEQMAAVDKARAAAEARLAAVKALPTAFLRAVFGVIPVFTASPVTPQIPVKPGWKWHRLTDIARLATGHTPSRYHSEFWKGTVPWLQLADIRVLDGHEAQDTAEHTNELGLANSSSVLLPKDTVCMSRTASVGFFTVMGRPMCTSQDFVNWVCGDALAPWFLLYLLIASREKIRDLGSGAVHKTIYFPTVKNFSVCVPPLAEQRRLADILRAQITTAEQARAAAEAELAAINALPAALLRRAFNGEL